jgi:probable insertion element IS1016 transposase
MFFSSFNHLVFRANLWKPFVCKDYYRSYDMLDVSEFSHFFINHSTYFAERQNHINGIENLGNQAKRHLRKFNGIPQGYF